MQAYEVPFWKFMPFFRLLIPFIIGIIGGWYGQLPWQISAGIAALSLLAVLGMNRLGLRRRYQWAWLQGIFANLAMAAMGAWLVWFHNIENHPYWFGHNYKPGTPVQLVLQEPLSPKAKTWKAVARVKALLINGQWMEQTGKVIVYFSKDDLVDSLGFASVLLTAKPVQSIKNAGNPGGFDYKRYCLFKGITHQVFLKQEDYEVLRKSDHFSVYRHLYALRDYLLRGLQRYIAGVQERSIAEALLIGYREHLERDLVQMYSNTGVVHIIAISGLHLGLIYGTLLMFFRPLRRFKTMVKLTPWIILAILWTFALLTGASASVVRAALMFSFMVVGEMLGRKTNIYNTLCAAAFCMLCFNPFLLWDVGFQLSFAAVLGILIFMQPIARWMTFQNKILRYGWQLCAVTLSAQILTLPLCMYHFHQIPNLFLLSNIVAVPLGSIILFGEMLLAACMGIPALATLLGKGVHELIALLNQYIAYVDAFRFSVTDGINISALQALVLYVVILFAGIWLLQKKPAYLKPLLFSLIGFFMLQSFKVMQHMQQLQLVIYNVPGHSAMDLMVGKEYVFVGDTVLTEEGFLQNFHLKPTRIRYGVHKADTLKEVITGKGFTCFGKLNIVHYSGQKLPQVAQPRIETDLLVISKGAYLPLQKLLLFFQPRLVVIDSSNPAYQIKQWQEEADRLKIKVFATAYQGAFVQKL